MSRPGGRKQHEQDSYLFLYRELAMLPEDSDKFRNVHWNGKFSAIFSLVKPSHHPSPQYNQTRAAK